MPKQDSAQAGLQAIGSWNALVPQEWRKLEYAAEAIIEVYSSALGRGSAEQLLASSALQALKQSEPRPLAYEFIKLEKECQVPSGSMMSCYRAGQRQLFFKVEQATVPPGDYLVLISLTNALPDGGTGEGPSRDLIARARGLLLGVLGHTATDQKVASFRVDIQQDDRTSYSSPAVENYEPASKFRNCSPESLQLLSERFPHLSSELQGRLNLALTLLGSAASEMDGSVRFTNMWIALETAAGGYGKVLKVMQTLCGPAASHRAFEPIKTARDNLFHHGKRYYLSQDQEKFLCAAVVAITFSSANISDPGLKSYLSTADPSVGINWK
jgi:hypothetical protein